MSNEKLNDVIIGALNGEPTVVKDAVYDILQGKVETAVNQKRAEMSPELFGDEDDTDDSFDDGEEIENNLEDKPELEQEVDQKV